MIFRRRHFQMALRRRENISRGGLAFGGPDGVPIRGDTAIASADKLAGLQEQPNLVAQRVTLLFAQFEPAGELKFVGGGIGGFAEKGEQTIA